MHSLANGNRKIGGKMTHKYQAGTILPAIVVDHLQGKGCLRRIQTLAGFIQYQEWWCLDESTESMMLHLRSCKDAFFKLNSTLNQHI
jgi:hypothetical protein